MDLMLDVQADSVQDTLQLVPFLFITYLAMEALEHSAGDKAERIIAGAGKAGPVLGALLGAIPQCGFSAMAATLFAGGVVTVGTLVSVILSTSDELVPVFLAHQDNLSRLAAIVAIKAAVGMVVGLLVDVVVRSLNRQGDGKPHIHELCERSHCGCETIDGNAGEHAAHAHDHGRDHEHDHEHDHGHCEHAGHGHGHAHDHAHEGDAAHGRIWHIVRSAIIHTIEVTLFIFVISLAFGFVIELAGQDKIAAFLSNHPTRATFLAALIGLIPNCGASVAITELFLAGTLATGPMLAGLLASGGVGLLVLFRTNRDMRQNLMITALVYGVGVVVGLVANAFGIII